MPTKVWQTEDIRAHLLALQSGLLIGGPAELEPEMDDRQAAYRRGCWVALTHLAQRFGVTLEQSANGPVPVDGKRLVIWNRSDIERNLKVAWAWMRASKQLSGRESAELELYYAGIAQVLQLTAMAFGIEKFTLPG